MDGELKVKSFRATDETFEKFKRLAEDDFGNQGQCLSALINLYEIETSKAVLVNRGLEIESFQDYLNKISSLFLTSLQLNQDAEGRIREEFARQLESKDRIILDLQTKQTDLTSAKESLEESTKELKDECRELTTRLYDFEKMIEKQNKDYAAALSDKDNLNKALTDACNERKIEIESLRLAREDADLQLKKLKDIESENAKLRAEINNLTNEIHRQKELSEFEKEKSLLESDKIHQKEIKEINSAHNDEIKTYLNKIDKLQEQITLIKTTGQNEGSSTKNKRQNEGSSTESKIQKQKGVRPE